MGGEAKNTNIPDPDGAASSLAAMAAHAELLQDKVTQAVAKITGHEAGEPWGTAPEFGGQFKKVYQAGKDGNGSEFVKDNVSILSKETAQGVTQANLALQASVELDKDIATMFTTPDSTAVGQRMIDDAKARQALENPEGGE